MNPAKPRETMFQPLLLALFSVALSQVGCGPGEPEPHPAPTPKPQPTPKVETRTLHELAAADDTDALRQALRLGQAVDAPNALGQTPLHVAAIQDKPANIEALLVFRANLHAKTQKEKVDALYLACTHGSLDAIKQLVAQGGKPNSTAPNGWTAVHAAAIHGRDTVLQLLHDLGKGLSPLCPDGTPLDFARIHKRNSTVQLLTQLGAKKGATLSVHLAARHGDLEALDGWLKRNRANVHFRMKKHRATPLHWAAEADQAQAAELLINHGADKTARTDGGWTPLHSAAAKGSTNVIALLLLRRAPVNAISQSGTPLDLAKGYRQPEAAALIEAKRGRAGREVSIHMAAAKGDAVAVQAFLRRGVKVDVPGPLHKSTPLHWAAGAGKVNTMELLIALGADVGALSNSDTTPLHQAVLHNRLEAVELLIRNNANLNSQNKSGHTPLDYATANGWEDLTRLLQTAGAVSGKTL
ncbi:MAG: ankyrin repeat domain-containing protein [Verrucomicrobiota bacterium]|jgi:ankyrin|nr:ankyrin repeat domain-containing protein [Verrucomicrobiota bacterium]MDP7049097.1 ankyrin repeat domain-containing protein [Verrucomicrobiota bacterium]